MTKELIIWANKVVDSWPVVIMEAYAIMEMFETRALEDGIELNDEDLDELVDLVLDEELADLLTMLD